MTWWLWAIQYWRLILGFAAAGAVAIGISYVGHVFEDRAESKKDAAEARQTTERVVKTAKKVIENTSAGEAIRAKSKELKDVADESKTDESALPDYIERFLDKLYGPDEEASPE